MLEGWITAFVDDVFEKRVVVTGTAEEAVTLAVATNSAFDAIAEEGGVIMLTRWMLLAI